MRINHRYKSTISVKMFIVEFGENFSEQIKKRLMDLEVRCLLKRDDVDYILDLKHVEHIMYDCSKEGSQKEYAYAQLGVIEGVLYFSENCVENNKIVQSPTAKAIYSSISEEGLIFNEGRNLKKIDDSNIDYVVDTILSTCPPVTERYKEIVKGMISRAKN